MKLIVEKEKGNVYRIKLSQGVQSFMLAYRGAKPDCEWYAKMFRVALANHVHEKLKRLKHEKKNL